MGIQGMESLNPGDIAGLADQKKLERLGRQWKKGDKGQDKDARLREASKGFEAIFMNKMWQQMRSTVPKNDYLHSKEEEFYLSMFDRELSQKLADAGGIGLGKMLYDSLKDKLGQASQKSTSLKPLRGEPAVLNPLPGRSGNSLGAASFAPAPATAPIDQGAMQEVEQLIRKIEREHGAEASPEGFSLDA